VDERHATQANTKKQSAIVIEDCRFQVADWKTRQACSVKCYQSAD